MRLARRSAALEDGRNCVGAASTMQFTELPKKSFEKKSQAMFIA